MKTALAVLSTLTLLGCSQENVQSLPTAPGLPVSPAWFWGMVVNEGGVCIAGGTATVVSGQGLGRTITQTTPCDAWAYDGGFTFRDLTAGVAMTLRVSAPGYAEAERTVVPSSGAQTAFVFTLSRIR
jgi:hypothetical protein